MRVWIGCVLIYKASKISEHDVLQTWLKEVIKVTSPGTVGTAVVN